MNLFDFLFSFVRLNAKNVYLNAPRMGAPRGNKYPVPHQSSREIMRRQMQKQRVVAVRENKDGTVQVREMSAWLSNAWLADHSGTAVPMATLQAFNEFNLNLTTLPEDVLEPLPLSYYGHNFGAVISDAEVA